ncbi:SCP-like protein, partial [Teladorsagia circumcincta]
MGLEHWLYGEWADISHPQIEVKGSEEVQELNEESQKNQCRRSSQSPLFQPEVLLLIRGGSGQIDTQSDLNAYIAQRLNEFRQSVANGTAFKNGGHLPGTVSMFPLKSNQMYEMIANLSSEGCVVQQNIPLPQGVEVSMNFFSRSYLPSSISGNTLADFALSNWEQEPYLFGIGDDVMYTNETLKEFANVGCPLQDNTVWMPLYRMWLLVNNAKYKNVDLLYGFNRACSTQSTSKATEAASSKLASESTAAPGTMAEETTTEVTSETTEASSTTASESTAESSTTSMATNPITQKIRDKVIFMHNFRRSRLAQGLVPNGLSGHNAPPGQNINNMSYSIDLESEAQKYADECAASGSSLESRNNTGENFGTVSTSSANTYYDAVVQAIRSFWDEIKITVINKEMLFTYVLSQRQKAPLRFTQMAWASTNQVGCGAKHCGDNYVVVCRYSPRGNILWETIYETGQTCVNCGNGCT